MPVCLFDECGISSFVDHAVPGHPTIAIDEDHGEIANGTVGNWTLGDAEFLTSFALPTSADKYDRLAVANPFPRDERIVFHEDTHIYMVDGGTKAPWSVTAFSHQCEHPFEQRSVIDSMITGRNWQTKLRDFVHPDGTPFTVEEICRKWDLNGKVQSARGTLMHYHIEMSINGKRIQEPKSPDFMMFEEFRRSFMDPLGFVPIRTEVNLMSCGLRLVGQADLLARARDGSLVIFDWKRTKDMNSKFLKYMKYPLGGLKNDKYHNYCLQLNTYRYILESEYGETVSSMFLGVFHPNQNNVPHVWKVKRMDKEIGLLVQFAKDVYGASDPLLGRDAPFDVTTFSYIETSSTPVANPGLPPPPASDLDQQTV